MIVKVCILVSVFYVGYSQLIEHPFEYGFEATPCSRWRPGDADLHTFDLIREFRLDQAAHMYESVTRTAGSNQFQTAYSLTRESNLTMQAYEAFPRGIPHQFSFECTFRSRERAVEPWYLFHLSNAYEESQMYVKIDPSSYTVEMSLPMITGELQVVQFEHRELFDHSWHKVMWGVTNEMASLWIDCRPIRYEDGSYFAKLETRGYLDTSAGYVSVARFAESSVLSAPSPEVDLQWMVVSCDPTKPTKENCDELPSYAAAGLKPDLPTAPGPRPQQSCDVVCPQGPRGFNGTDGRAGPPGPRGLIGPVGMTGARGKPGPRGVPGQPGASFAAKGEKGDRGEAGLPGLDGAPGPKGEAAYAANGIKGEKGDVGERGDRGFQGEKGEQGLPGLTGPQGPPGIVTGDGAVAVSGPKGEPGEPGVSGLQGVPGPPGPPGAPGPAGYSYAYQGQSNNDQLLESLGYLQAGQEGERGPPGPQGERGLPGQRGPTGKTGPPGRAASDGEIRNICLGIIREELMMFERAAGPAGPPGKAGPPGRGYPGEPGPQGPRGENGHPGQPGPEGPQGSRGQPGDKGDRGQDGVGRDGLPGLPGPIGPQGQPGEDIQGTPGRAGDPGPPGARGPAGTKGEAGTCPMDCLYAAQAYMAMPQMSKGPPAYTMSKGPPAYSIKG